MRVRHNFARAGCISWRFGVCLGVGLNFFNAGAAPVPVTALTYSAGGDALLSNGPRRVDVRSPVDGTVQRSFSCDLPKITALLVQPGAGVLAVAGGAPAVSGEVRLYDFHKGQLAQVLPGGSDLSLALAFNSEGTLLAEAGGDGVVRIWRVEEKTAAVALSLEGHTGPVLAAAFSASGELILTAGADRSIKVWSIQEGRLLRTLSYHTETVHALAFRPLLHPQEDVPEACASGGADRTVRIWQPAIGRMVRIIRNHDGAVFALAYAPDGSALFSAGEEGVIRRLDPDSDAVLGQWNAHQDWIYALAVSPDGKRLASGDWAGRVCVRSLRP